MFEAEFGLDRQIRRLWKYEYGASTLGAVVIDKLWNGNAILESTAYAPQIGNVRSYVLCSPDCNYLR